MSAKSYGTKKPRNNQLPKKLLYKGELHKVLRHDAGRGVYLLQSKSNPKEVIEVPVSDYLPNSSLGSGKR
jgi:hypothetical protein